MQPRSCVILLAALLAACNGVDTPPSATSRVGAAPVEVVTVNALGRLKPKDGIIRLAGPSRMAIVIAKLLVEEGDRVEQGQPIAILDTLAEDEARVARARSELANAQTELGRVIELFHQGVAAVSLRDTAQLKVDVAKAE